MAEKNRYGQYFTIRPIADFMVTLIAHSRDSRVLEPSCGKGVFLDSLAEQGFSNLSAYEIDASLGTSHSCVKFSSFLSVPTSEKYDVVIGNPPYIRWKNIEPELKEELERNELWNKYFNSLCDYLFVFILKSIEHLEEGGELIFICTDYWLNTTHSASLRKYMCENGYFSEIYHFREAPLFEKVTASFIIFRYIKGKVGQGSISLFRYNKERGLPTPQELATRSCFDKEEIPQFAPKERWVLASQAQQVRLARFEAACAKPQSSLFPADETLQPELNRIGQYCDIGNGMVSGLDAAFQIKDTAGLNPDERRALITVMKAKDLSPYINKSTTSYIFLQESISETAFEEKYPHFAEHFRPHLEKLARRYSYSRQIPYWEFVFPRNQKLFERKEARIFVPCKERVSNKDYFRFCYAPEGCYPTQNVTAIFRKPKVRESLEYILAYLNNPRVFEWLGYNGIIKGDIVEFSEAPIASIPFRRIDWQQEEEVRLHDRITEEVRAYLHTSASAHIATIHQCFNLLFHEAN